MSKDNMLLGYARGKVGSLVFARRLGQQITRAYNKTPKDASTKSQVQQRVRMANVIAMYRAVKRIADHSFEGVKPGQTSYNLFVKANLTNNSVVLTKEAASFGACVVAPYLISRGTLPSIIVQGTGADAVTNIAVGSLVINETTTIGAFSQAVVASNTGINYGDQLTYVSIVQKTDSNTGYPVATATIYEVTLNQADELLLRNYMPEVATTVRNGFLAHGTLIASGGFCWILSRKNADGSLSVSTQRIVLTSKDVAGQYSSAVAMTRAINSYGFNPDAILIPESGGQAAGSGESSAPSVSSVALNDVTLVANETLYQTVKNGANTILVNGSNLSADSAVSVKIGSNTYEVTVEPGSPATQLGGYFNTSSAIEARSLEVIIDGVTYYTWQGKAPETYD